VLDFGTATSTDFTSILQAAIDSVSGAGGGSLLIPRIASGTYALGEISVPANMHIKSEPGVVFYRNVDIADGRGWFNVEGTNVTFENVTWDGAVTTAVGLLYGTGTSSILFNNDPLDDKLTLNSTLWIHPGSNDVKILGCSIQHTGGYAVLADVVTGDTENLTIELSTFRNNRPNLFGTSTSSMNCGGWSSGIFVKGDCTGTNTFALNNLNVNNCFFERNSGNQIWSHSYGFDVQHKNFTITNNTFRNIALDCIQPGNVTNCVIKGNVAEYVGFVTESDIDTPTARAALPAYAVAYDASGYVDNLVLEGNTCHEVYGGFIDLDGARKASVVSNVGFTSQTIGKGIQTGNTSANGGATNVRIAHNYLEGFTNGAVILSEAIGCTVEHNTIQHPSGAATVPITIYSPVSTPTNNVIRFNRIAYEANFLIVEDRAGGTSWGTGNVNYVYGNRTEGTCPGEFYKDAASSSITGQYFPSNQGTLSGKSDYFLQSEGVGDSASFKFYHVGTASAVQLMDLVRRRTSGVDSPYLRIGTAAGDGGIATGGRTTFGAGDFLASGKHYTYGFNALLGKTVAGNNYVTTEANALGTDWALWRYDETGPKLQFSTSVTSGTRNWTDLGAGGSPGGSNTQIQFNALGAFSGDAGFIWNNITKQVTVACSTSTLAGVTVSTGYVNSANGFLTTAANTDAIQAPSGGVTAKYLINTVSLSMTGTSSSASGLSGSGQGRIYFDSTANRFKVSENGGAYVNLTGGLVAGSTTQIQFNTSGAFDATTKFVYDKTNNRLGVGVTSPIAPLHVVSTETVNAIDTQFTKDSSWFLCQFEVFSSSANAHSPFFIMKRAGGSAASPSSVASGYQLGGFSFRGYDGSSDQQSAIISALVESSVSSGNVPTYISFQTGYSSASTAERMRLTSTGLLYINRTTDDGTGYPLQISGSMRASTYVVAGSVIKSEATGSATAFQVGSGIHLVDGNGNASGGGTANYNGGYKVAGNTIINSSGVLDNAFGVNVNAGVGATGFNIYGGSYFGQTGTIGFNSGTGKLTWNGSDVTTIQVRGGVVTIS
jgi:hypothetical protein